MQALSNGSLLISQNPTVAGVTVQLCKSVQEDALRNAISLGGDADTLAAITGGIAEAFYGGVPEAITHEVLSRLDESLRQMTLTFRDRYMPTYHYASHSLSGSA